MVCLGWVDKGLELRARLVAGSFSSRFGNQGDYEALKKVSRVELISFRTSKFRATTDLGFLSVLPPKP